MRFSLTDKSLSRNDFGAPWRDNFSNINQDRITSQGLHRKGNLCECFQKSNIFLVNQIVSISNVEWVWCFLQEHNQIRGNTNKDITITWKVDFSSTFPATGYFNLKFFFFGSSFAFLVDDSSVVFKFFLFLL